MKTLVLCDDYWHPAQIVQTGLSELGKWGYNLDFVTDVSQWPAGKIDEYSLVVLAKSNNISAANTSPWMTAETQQQFVDFVRAGGGLLAIHSGTADYEKAMDLRALLGGVFASHPPQCSVTVQPVAGHPFPAGFAPFTVVDEHYHMDLDDPGVDVFLQTTSEHGTQPGGWLRREGNGRVAVLTPGHNEQVWQHPHYQEIIRACLAWCAGKE